MKSNSENKFTKSQPFKMVIDQNFKEICEDSFAKWSIAIWRSCIFDELSFEESKQAFFYLVERLLAENRIKFDLPLNDKRNSEFWNDDVAIIVAHLSKNWPQNANKYEDREIIDFFYDSQKCPPVSWLGEDGNYYSS